MALIKLFLLFSYLAFLVQAVPVDPDPAPAVIDTAIAAPYTIDYFLVRKACQFALQDVIAYKEATTSRLDPLPNPPSDTENEIRYILDDLRVTAFYAYDKLIFLANSQVLTLTYATQTFVWYDNAFSLFTNKIRALVNGSGFPDSVKVELLSLLDQIQSQTSLHNFIIKLLLTVS